LGIQKAGKSLTGSQPAPGVLALHSLCAAAFTKDGFLPVNVCNDLFESQLPSGLRSLAAPHYQSL
jgi:hypothetical protein